MVSNDQEGALAGLRSPTPLAGVLVCILVVLLGWTSIAGAQTGVEILGSGSADTLDPPPAPSCADPVFITTAMFDPLGNPAAIPRFGEGVGLVTVHNVPDFAVGPGEVHFDEVITHDGYTNRSGDAGQLSERVRIDLLLNGSIVASTPPTPDLIDSVRSAWVAASLGSISLPNGADGLRIVHVGDGASPNSLIVSGLCLRTTSTGSDDGVGAPDETVPVAGKDEPGTEPAAGRDDPSSGPVGAADGSTTGTTRPPATAPTTEVLPQLALTGADVPFLVSLAALLIMSGTALVRRDERRDPRNRPNIGE